jgi:uncharacterized protein YaiI (UPF0178 family)
MLKVYVDADACPVKEEVYRVALRYEWEVKVVANQWMRVPNDGGVELVKVDGGFDAADDWIVEQVGEKDIVVTADIPLAARCLEKGARVLGLKGREFTEDSIGDALATRELMSQLRDMGEVSSGPPPFQKKDRSQFLQALDTIIQAIRREG